MLFHEKLNSLCELRRLTNQRELAKLAGVSKSSLNRWLSGQSVPDALEVGRLARVLETSVDFLVDETQEDPSAAEPDLSVDELIALETYREIRSYVGPTLAVRELGRYVDAIRTKLADGGDPKELAATFGPAPAYPSPSPLATGGTGRPLGARNETEAHLRREAERRRRQKDAARAEARARQGGNKGGNTKKDEVEPKRNP